MTGMKALRNAISDTMSPKGTIAGEAVPVKMVKDPMAGNTIAGPAMPIKRRK